MERRKIRVYTASKLCHGPKWKDLQHAWPEVHITARWFQLHIGHVPDEGCFAKVFWVHDEEDVTTADVVMIYGEEGEHLRGALVEAGMGIALGKEVIVVGEHPDYGTWQHHPKVHKAKDLEEARLLLHTMSLGL